jgi:hypothetical protein
MDAANRKHLPETRLTGSASTEEQQKIDAGRSEMHKDGVQGEGNYDAARAFNEAERKFVASGKVDAAARAAAPKSEAEQRAMIAAEEEGKGRAKEEDPALTRASSDSGTPSAFGKDDARNGARSPESERKFK